MVIAHLEQVKAGVETLTFHQFIQKLRRSVDVCEMRRFIKITTFFAVECSLTFFESQLFADGRHDEEPWFALKNDKMELVRVRDAVKCGRLPCY